MGCLPFLSVPVYLAATANGDAFSGAATGPAAARNGLQILTARRADYSADRVRDFSRLRAQLVEPDSELAPRISGISPAAGEAHAGPNANNGHTLQREG